jgi:hypothetical protein
LKPRNYYYATCSSRSLKPATTTARPPLAAEPAGRADFRQTVSLIDKIRDAREKIALNSDNTTSMLRIPRKLKDCKKTFGYSCSQRARHL